MYDRSVLERQHRKVHKNKNAEVAELADAQASGACGSNTVRVQVPPSAFFFYLRFRKIEKGSDVQKKTGARRRFLCSLGDCNNETAMLY